MPFALGLVLHFAATIHHLQGGERPPGSVEVIDGQPQRREGGVDRPQQALLQQLEIAYGRQRDELVKQVRGIVHGRRRHPVSQYPESIALPG